MARTFARYLTVAAALAAAVRALWHYAPPAGVDVALVLPIGSFFVLYGWRAARALPGRMRRESAWPRRLADVLISIGAILGLVVIRPVDAVLVVAHAILIVRALSTWPEFAGRLPGIRFRPAIIIAGSFAALVLVGTALLLLPASTAAGVSTRPLDALFTATSAACVTGLIVVDTGTFWSPFGHAVILTLIEVGGIGIMTLWAGILILAGRQLGMRETVALGGVLESEGPRALRRMVRRIVLWTLTTEAIGAVLLFRTFLGEEGTVSVAAGHAVFHSVSAFCNAGFALYPDSLTRFGGRVAPMVVVMALITLGGLGFPVLDEMRGRVADLLKRRRSHTRSFHARIVIVTSGILTAFAALAIFFFEYDRTLGSFFLPHRVLASLFQAVTLRTAGFNTIDCANLAPPTLVVMIAMMLIGAAPASTGGGIKVTTIGVLYLTVRSFVRKRNEVEAFGRRVSPVVVQKAIAIAFASLALVFIGMLLLASVESASFEALLFETASALGTVGLSTGITPSLTDPGRLTIIALMFLGRIGPLTLALAVGRRARPARYRFPEGRVFVG